MDDVPEQQHSAVDSSKTIRISSAELSRCHGLASGVVCASPAGHDEQNSKRAAQLPGAVLPGVGFSALLEHVRQTLSDENCAFRAQIPGDDKPLSRRAAALAGWCQGFLEGFALASQPAVAGALAPDVSELLADISNIAAGLEADDMAPNNDNERDFVDITSFVEVAAMNIYLSTQQIPEPESQVGKGDPGGGSAQ